MRNFSKAVLRWLYIVILYGVFAVPIFFGMKSVLESQLVDSPFGYSLNNWLGNIYGMFFNTLAISLALVVLWNLLFYRHFLGKRGLGRGGNALNWSLIFLHVALSAGSLAYLLNSPYNATWFFSLLNGSEICFVMLLLPMLLVIPFFFATRLLAPEIISYRFSMLKGARSKIGLLYY